MKVFFTDSGSGLTKESATALGLVYIPHNILYKGEEIKDRDGVILDEAHLKVAAPNAQQYREAFEKYPNAELVYVTWSQRTKATQTFEQIRQQRVMAGKTFDDIKHFFIVRNTTTGWIPIVKNKFCLFTMDDGAFKLLKTFDTQFAALAELKKHVNTKLYYRKEMNSVIGLHCGKDYIGGMKL